MVRDSAIFLQSVSNALQHGRYDLDRAFLGDSSLAAMGATTAIFDLVVGFATGIGAGFGIVAGHYYGASDTPGLKKHRFFLPIERAPECLPDDSRIHFDALSLESVEYASRNLSRKLVLYSNHRLIHVDHRIL